MPGAFVDPEMERVWLANTAAQCYQHDTCVYAVCGIIHLVEVARFTPSATTQLAAQLLCVRAPAFARVCTPRWQRPRSLTRPAFPAKCALLLLLLPALTMLRTAWYMRNREAVIVVVRLAAAAAAPVWMRRGALAEAPGYSGGWLSRSPLLFLAVRLPMHVAISVVSFWLTLSVGNLGRLGMRVSWALIDVVIRAWFESVSRGHFAVKAAALRNGGKGSKAE